MPEQTGPQDMGPTGKLKNCGSWAEYEPPDNSPGAALCHGGWYEGDFYKECPSKYECRRDTREKERRPSLPIVNPSRPFGSRILGSTPNIGERLKTQLRPYGPPPYTPPPYRSGEPTTIPVKGGDGKTAAQTPQQWWAKYQQGHPHIGAFPYPIIPPREFPAPMQTPFAAPMPFHIGGLTPTYLPRDNQSIWSRLGKNIMQGLVGATGWQIFDYARSVDLFGS